VVGTIVYRIVRRDVPTADDFRSQQQLGRPLRDERWRREWAEGVSTHDSLDHAVAQAVALKLRAGRYVVPQAIPEDGRIEARQTGADPRHITVYATGDDALLLVCGPTILVGGPT
jgi:hypothetical protein